MIKQLILCSSNTYTKEIKMGIKSDKWIKDQSTLDHFGIEVNLGDNGYIKNFIGLPELLDNGFTIEELSYPQNRQAMLTQSTGKAWLYACKRFDHPNNPVYSLRFKRGSRDISDPRNDLFAPMIYPFYDQSKSEIVYRGEKGKVPSYGLSSHGYDIRLGDRFLVADSRYKAGFTSQLDFMTTKNSPSEEHLFIDRSGDAIDLLPHQFMLGVSMEHVNIPRNVIVECLQKSTIARKGCLAFVTPLECHWSGYITLEIVNCTELPMRLYAGMGIMQLIFHEADEPCEVSYAERSGKYMWQSPIPVISRL